MPENPQQPFAPSNPRTLRNESVFWFLGGLLLFILLIEAGLRLILGLGNPILIQSDAACAYLLKPDQDVHRFFVNTHINHYGMRSDELPPARQPGSLRLMFVGDSLTYGTTRVDQRKIFTELLHRQLPALLHRPIEVLNASASAWAPDNELAYLRSRGIFQSDIVLLVLNDGDLTQPRSTLADVGEDLPSRRPLTAIGELWTRYLRPRLLHLTQKADAGDQSAANAEATTRSNLANLDSIHSLVAAQGARLVVVYIPFRRDIPQPAAAQLATLRSWTDANLVPLLDLTSAEAPYSATQITLDNGIHLNAEGHRIIANAIENSWPQLALGAARTATVAAR